MNTLGKPVRARYGQLARSRNWSSRLDTFAGRLVAAASAGGADASKRPEPVMHLNRQETVVAERRQSASGCGESASDEGGGKKLGDARTPIDSPNPKQPATRAIQFYLPKRHSHKPPHKMNLIQKLGAPLVPLVLILLAVKETKVEAQSCHMRELDLCAATLVVFTQSPSGLAANDHDLNKQCGYLREADTCLRNFIKRCTTPLQGQMVGFLGEGSMDLLDDYCKPGTELRKAYLKHATCLNQAQKSHQKGCIKDLQASFESLTAANGANWHKQLPLGCCTYRRFEQCISSQVEKKCGKEALGFLQQILKRAFSRMPEMMCRKYKPDGKDCKALLPPLGTLPKGSKSTSVVSRLFSAYTGV